MTDEPTQYTATLELDIEQATDGLRDLSISSATDVAQNAAETAFDEHLDVVHAEVTEVRKNTNED